MNKDNGIKFFVMLVCCPIIYLCGSAWNSFSYVLKDF